LISVVLHQHERAVGHPNAFVKVARRPLNRNDARAGRSWANLALLPASNASA
jgi:hypothetical protein